MGWLARGQNGGRVSTRDLENKNKNKNKKGQPKWRQTDEPQNVQMRLSLSGLATTGVTHLDVLACLVAS